MIDNKSSNNQKASQEYKECAGKGCQNAGIYYLKILYLNKSGWFCDDCRNALTLDKLINEGPQSDPLTTPQSLARPSLSAEINSSNEATKNYDSK